MKLFKCSEAEKITLDPDTAMISIYLKDNEGIMVISLPELLAFSARACMVVASNEELPANFILNLQEKVEIEKKA